MHYNVTKQDSNTKGRFNTKNNNDNDNFKNNYDDNILNHKYPSSFNNLCSENNNNKNNYYDGLHNDINEKISNINYLIESNKKENKIKAWNDNYNYNDNDYDNNNYNKNSSRKSDREFNINTGNYNNLNNNNYLNKFINNNNNNINTSLKNQNQNVENQNDENQNVENKNVENKNVENQNRGIRNQKENSNYNNSNRNINLFEFSNLDEVKNNKNGIKLNLEEEIFLQFLLDFIKLSKETEEIRNELARKKDFSIIKLFKIFQAAEEESNKIMNYERNNLIRNFNETINIIKEKNNYPNTFNKTQRYYGEENRNKTKKYFEENFNNTTKNIQEIMYQSFPSNMQNQNFNQNQYQNYTKENIITKFSFKKTLNDMGIYPTLIEMKLIFNRFNNKFPDFG